MMKKLYLLLFVQTIQLVFSQSIADTITRKYQTHSTEKVYVQLNNVLYEPTETVYYKIMCTQANCLATEKSNYIFVEIYDAAQKLIFSTRYFIENGFVKGSFTLPNDIPGGIFKLRAFTNWQKQVDDAIFEKTFFVQKVLSPRILMQLEFQKKSYGKGEIAIADFTLKNKENIPLKNYRLSFEILKDGNIIDILSSQTNEFGKAILQYKLPDVLNTKDVLFNVKVDYDNQQESITRAVPIPLEIIDLQFLPESGHLVTNQANTLFFIAKNEQGLPLDCAGTIVDENGNDITSFASIHDGMGKCEFTPKLNQKYFAKLNSPFYKEIACELPKAETDVFAFHLIQNEKIVEVQTFSPIDTNAEIIVRNSNLIIQKHKIKLQVGFNATTINTQDLKIGVHTISLLYNNEIVAESLFFANANKTAHVTLKTDKETYFPREKVTVNITTQDENNKPISTELAISVVDQKLLTYVDDKQHNLLTWMLLGSELQHAIYEPKFYFDSEKPLVKRTQAIELLLNTHGWRKYNQNNYTNPLFAKQLESERKPFLSGFITSDTNTNLSQKIWIIISDGKIYETKSDSKGYFTFPNFGIEKSVTILVKNTKKDYFQVITENNNTAFEELKKKYSTIHNLSINNKEFTKLNTNDTQLPEQLMETKVNQDFVIDNEPDDKLSEVVVASYNSIKSKEVMTASISTVSSEMITRTLDGSIAGVRVLSGYGQPGLSGKILIRGITSISNNCPLYVVDGVPIYNPNSLPAFFSVKDIKSIYVMKGTEATAIYGSAGQFGVIVIQTQSGSNGFPIKELQFYSSAYIHGEDVKQNHDAFFYMPMYETIETYTKTDFRNCIYWNNVVQTDLNGKASISFYNSDATTSFNIAAEGISYNGLLAHQSANYAVTEPLEIDVKSPLYTTVEDKCSIPIWIKNNTENTKILKLSTILPNELQLLSTIDSISIQPHEAQTIYLDLQAISPAKKTEISIFFRSENFVKSYLQNIDIYAKGFPASISFAGTESIDKTFFIHNLVPHSLASSFKMYINPVTVVFDNLENLIREPSGCFEQVSSSNYPNIMALHLLESQPMNNEFKKKAIQFLEKGYQKLKNYESKDGGFELYGGNPGNPTLTAYGLLQFSQMKKYVNVDEKMMKRSIEWLLNKRDGKGNFGQPTGYYGVAAMSKEVSNTFILYVLSEIGKTDNLNLEYQKALQFVYQNEDLYTTSLMASTAYNFNDKKNYSKLLQKLNAIIEQSKGLDKIKYSKTIVNSSYNSSLVESLSLYALAIMKERKIIPNLIDIIHFIQTQKTNYGFGSTHATALALKTIAQFISINNLEKPAELPKLIVNNCDEDTNQKDIYGNITIQNIPEIQEGKNMLLLGIEDKQITTPYHFSVTYNTYLPENSKDAIMKLQTSLLQKTAKMGDVVRAEIVISNTLNEVVFDPIVRIGIPGGTTPEIWQLREWIEQNIVDYYEILNNELVLYFRAFNRLETKKLSLNLKAIIPGSYQATASSAYLYYHYEDKNWNEGLSLSIEK